ncbi:Fc.00g009910.m01.CDS01 [Cosmosporella sp. VM-42]
MLLIGYACSHHSSYSDESTSSNNSRSSNRNVKLPGSKPTKQRRSGPAKLYKTVIERLSKKPTKAPPLRAHGSVDEIKSSDPEASPLPVRSHAVVAKSTCLNDIPVEKPPSTSAPLEPDSIEEISDSDSTGSGLSDTESVISVASSATTVDGDALELIFHRLLQFEDLRYLWPQLIERSSWKRSQRAIERLLRRYAEDLQKLANKPLDSSIATSDSASEKALKLSAARFVRRSRLNLAQRICEAHYLPSDPNGEEQDQGVDRDGGQCLPGGDGSDTDEEESIDVNTLIADQFLFGTEPVLYLQANLKALVRISETDAGWDIKGATRLCLDKMFGSWETQPLSSGRRICWTCTCGKRLYDDFVELRPGALSEFEKQLQQYGRDAVSMEPFDAGIASHSKKAFKDIFSGALTTCASTLGLIRQGKLPKFWQDVTRAKGRQLPGACRNTGGLGASDHNYLLLCIPFFRRGTQLHQPEICRINSDQDFLSLLRHCYQTQRGGISWTLLRKVTSIKFVKFEVYRRGLVDIHSCPSLPPDRTEYEYDPMPADVVPPIGPNHLAHLFEFPDHADVVPILWNRVPRKLRAELVACPIKGSSVGWGLQFVEGVDWVVFFLYGCLGFAVCLLVALIWAVAKGDVQSGFAIGGFLLAFVMYCGSVAYSAILE